MTLTEAIASAKELIANKQSTPVLALTALPYAEALVEMENALLLIVECIECGRPIQVSDFEQVIACECGAGLTVRLDKTWDLPEEENT